MGSSSVQPETLGSGSRVISSTTIALQSGTFPGSLFNYSGFLLL